MQPSSPKKAKSSASVTPTRAQTRQELEKAAKKRENVRLRQAKRRAKIKSNPQLYRRDREKRKNRRMLKKMVDSKDNYQSKFKVKFSFKEIINKAREFLKNKGSKTSLVQLDLVNNLKKKKDFIPTSTKTYYDRPPRSSFVVENFYENVSVDIPFQKAGGKPKKILTKRLNDVYSAFRNDHPDVHISFTTFKRLRPSHILLSGSRAFVQCLCERCVNAMLLVDVVNSYLKKKPESENEVTKRHKITCVEELVTKTLCVDAGKDCVERNCRECGVESLLHEIREEVGDRMTEMREWKRWEKTEYSPKDLVSRQNSLADILRELTVSLFDLAKHLKTAQWQRRQYQMLRENLPPRHGLLTVDFAENYVCKFQHEVQSAHWAYRQVSVHPCVFFYRCNYCKKSVTDYQVFLSDDLKHDSAITKHIFDKCLTFAESKGILSLQIFSDGCSSQYKSRLPFFHLTELQTLHPSLKIGRHFFGSSHGKSLCDSCGGTVKNFVSRAVKNAQVSIQNATDMFSFCESEMTLKNNDCQHIVRSFIHVRPEDINRNITSDDVNTVKGTRDIHCLLPSGNIGSLNTRNLSCFCSVCLLGEEGVCENDAYIGGWQSVSMVFKKQSVRKRLSRNVHRHENDVTSMNVTDLSVDVTGLTDTMAELNDDITSLDETGVNVDITGMSENIDNFSAMTNENNSSVEIDSNDDVFERMSKVLKEASAFDNIIFFEKLQNCLSQCSTMSSLKIVCKVAEAYIGKYDMRLGHHTLISIGFSVDKIALSLRPNGFESLYPVLTVGDGNCMPRALSLASFGSDKFHVELRCRAVLDLCLNKELYMNREHSELKQIAILSPCANGFNLDEPNDISDVFDAEVLYTSQLCRALGLWQLEAFSNVLQAKILSVYPDKGPASLRRLFQRCFTPRVCCHEQVIPILWTSDRSDMEEVYWVANHVVPLLPLSEPFLISYESL